jgi:hypothetical protein
MFMYTLCLLFGVLYNSIFFLVLSFFILTIATLDVIFFGLFLSIKIK